MKTMSMYAGKQDWEHAILREQRDELLATLELILHDAEGDPSRSHVLVRTYALAKARELVAKVKQV